MRGSNSSQWLSMPPMTSGKPRRPVTQIGGVVEAMCGALLQLGDLERLGMDDRLAVAGPPDTAIDEARGGEIVGAIDVAQIDQHRHRHHRLQPREVERAER